MTTKILIVTAMALSLGACASVPPPPHCEDTGQGLQPINPEMLTQAQIDAMRAPEEADYQPQRGRGRQGGLNQ